jgi:hypothetical protein
MNKQMLINQITEELRQLGIEPELGVTSDLTIRTQFRDYKRKIQFQANTIFDETKQVITYYETTRDNAFNLFFSKDGDDQVQFKYTWPRQIMVQQILNDGTIKEYPIYQSDIIECFKRIAKQHGWKVKTPLFSKAARY